MFDRHGPRLVPRPNPNSRSLFPAPLLLLSPLFHPFPPICWIHPQFGVRGRGSSLPVSDAAGRMTGPIMDRPPDSSAAAPLPNSRSSRIDASSHSSAPRLGNEAAAAGPSLTSHGLPPPAPDRLQHPTPLAFQDRSSQQPPRLAPASAAAVRRKPLPPSASPSPTLAPYFHGESLAGAIRPAHDEAAAKEDHHDDLHDGYESENRTEDDSLIDESHQHGLRDSTTSTGLGPRRYQTAPPSGLAIATPPNLAPWDQPSASGDSQRLVIRDLDQYVHALHCRLLRRLLPWRRLLTILFLGQIPSRHLSQRPPKH